MSFQVILDVCWVYCAFAVNANNEAAQGVIQQRLRHSTPTVSQNRHIFQKGQDEYADYYSQDIRLRS